MIMAYVNPTFPYSAAYEAVMLGSLAISMLLIFYITAYNYIRGGYIFVSYDIMVKRSLDEWFELFNINEQGLQWYVVPGHYWLEARISEIKKKQDKPSFPEESIPVVIKPFLDNSNFNNNPSVNVSKSRMNASNAPKAPKTNTLMQNASHLVP